MCAGRWHGDEGAASLCGHRQTTASPADAPGGERGSPHHQCSLMPWSGSAHCPSPGSLSRLPSPPLPSLQMDMAQKVLSSDFNNLIKAMKEAQKHYNTFLEGEYQKEMLKAAHVVAKNSKLLFDAVGSSTRRAQQIHR